MSPTKPRSRSRAAAETDADKPKTAKPRAAKVTKAPAAKTAKPRAAKPVQPETEAQHELFVSGASQAQPQPAPVHAEIAHTPAPSAEPEERRRGLLLFILIPLLMLGSFWIGRLTSPSPAAGAATMGVSPSLSAVTATATASEKNVTVSAATTPAKPTATVGVATRRGPESSLVEVSVGTTSRGGLTLRFDHAVSWKLYAGDAEVTVQGVRALGTFPRNLPLPPGATALHAAISAPDTLHLKFDLRPGVRIYTYPAAGPAAAVNVYFQAPGEEAAGPALPPGSRADAGACGVAAAAPTAKAIALLQRSLAKNPGYEAVRETLALLETCAGDGAQAEQLLAEGTQKDGNGVKLAVTDVALRYARGDVDGALQELKTKMPAGNDDAGYQQLLADLESGRQP